MDNAVGRRQSCALVLATTVFRGPNLHGTYPLVHFRLQFSLPAPGVDNRALGARFIRLFPALADAVRAALPAPELLAQLFMLAAVQLQRDAGAVLQAGTVQPAQDNLFDIYYGCTDTGTGLRAGRLALLLLEGVVWGNADGDEPLQRARRQFLHAARARVLPLEQRHVAEAATRRGIPWRCEEGHLVIFGQGRFQKRRLRHLNDRTSRLAWEISSDKYRCARLLADIGLPVPRQARAGSVDDAVRAAEKLGYPAVVKPLDSDFGEGVRTGLRTRDAVRRAAARVAALGRRILVEEHIPGHDYRLLVADGRMVAAARRLPAQVTGDGRHTVRELVEAANRDPRRGVKGRDWLVRLSLDDEAEELLKAAGLTQKSVPAPGQTVLLRHAANMAAGGTSIDVTDEVHPDNRAAAEWAAAVLALDMAGIDFICPDISRSYRDVGGAICEVNIHPGLSPHVGAEGRQRDVAGAILDTLYPPGSPFRVPVVIVAGGAGALATAQSMVRLLSRGGRTIGFATPIEVQAGAQRLFAGEAARTRGAAPLLHHPAVEAVVMHGDLDWLIEQGLGVAECDAAAVPDLPADAGTLYISAARMTLRAARLGIAIDGDDPRGPQLIDGVSAGRVARVTAGPDGSWDVDTHDKDGGQLAHAGRNTGFAAWLQGPVGRAWLEDSAGTPGRHAAFAFALARCLGMDDEARNPP